MVAGTYHGGLAIYRNARFTVEPEGARGIPSGWVNPHAIAVVDGALFVGTLDRGLVVGLPARWMELHVQDGLPSDDVTDVLADGPHSAWIATRGGLAHVVW
jgi:ligand-binding sensor domain-containing protein